jgi:hypothetical protein
VRWDAEIAEGADVRVLTSRPAGEAASGAGPSLDLSAHVALVPLVRIGVYAHHDASTEGQSLSSAGLDVRVLFPWLSGGLRGYVHAGVGEALAVAPAHALVGGAFVSAASGSLTEVPFAVGLTYRVDPGLWLSLEAGARLGFAFGGAAYGSGSAGDDALAVFLDAGVVWGR